MTEIDTDDTSTAFRQAATAAGFRTIGAEFDGSDDEGSVGYVGIPAGLDDEMLDAKALVDLKESTFGLLSLNKWVSGQGWVPNARVQQLLDLAKEHDLDLSTLFYEILEEFPGDWVNNEGGYGTVWLDLVSGEYWINGNQRVTTSEDAHAEGAYYEALVGADADLVRQMRSLLTS